MSDSPQFEQTLVLVDRAQRDDPAAVSELFSRYLPRVRRIVALRIGREQRKLLDLDDLTQDALLDAFRGLTTFSASSDASFVNWLSQIVVNRIRLTLRTATTEKRGGGKVRRFADAEGSSMRGSNLPGQSPTPSQHAVAAETLDRLSEGIGLLSDREREIVIQRAHCHMSYEEVVETMNFPNPAAARAYFSKALRKLNELVRDTAPED